MPPKGATGHIQQHQKMMQQKAMQAAVQAQDGRLRGVELREQQYMRSLQTNQASQRAAQNAQLTYREALKDRQPASVIEGLRQRYEQQNNLWRTHQNTTNHARENWLASEAQFSSSPSKSIFDPNAGFDFSQANKEQFQEQQGRRDRYFYFKQFDRLYYSYETEEERRYFIGESVEYYNTLYSEYVFAEDPLRRDDIEHQFDILEYLFSIALASPLLSAKDEDLKSEPFDAHFSPLTRDLLKQKGIETPEQLVNRIIDEASRRHIELGNLTGKTGEEVLLRYLVGMMRQDTLAEAHNFENAELEAGRPDGLEGWAAGIKDAVVQDWLAVYESLDIDPAINLSVVNWIKDHFPKWNLDSGDPVQVEEGVRAFLIGEIDSVETQYGRVPFSTTLLTGDSLRVSPVGVGDGAQVALLPSKSDVPHLALPGGNGQVALLSSELEGQPRDYSSMSIDDLMDMVSRAYAYAAQIEDAQKASVTQEYYEVERPWWESPSEIPALLNAPTEIQYRTDPRYLDASANLGLIRSRNETLWQLVTASEYNNYVSLPDPNLLLMVATSVIDVADWVVTGAEILDNLSKGAWGAAFVNTLLAITPYASGMIDNVIHALRYADNVLRGGVNVADEIADATKAADEIFGMGGGPDIPNLSVPAEGDIGRQMMREARNYLKQASPADRVSWFDNFRKQIEGASTRTWTASKSEVPGGTLFVGDQKGFWLLISDEGIVYEGQNIYMVTEFQSGKNLEGKLLETVLFRYDERGYPTPIWENIRQYWRPVTE